MLKQPKKTQPYGEAIKMKCPGLHCSGCNGGSGIGMALVIGGSIVILWARHSARAIDHTISEVVTFVTVSLFVLLGIGVTIGSGLIIRSIKKSRRESLAAIMQKQNAYLQSLGGLPIENTYQTPATMFIPSETISIKRNKD